MGAPDPGAKNGVCRYAPVTRAPMSAVASCSTPKVVASGVDRTACRADFVLTAIRKGPNVLRIAAASPRQLWTSPAYGTPQLRGVLTIGVAQQLAYQRNRPRSLNDRHARCCSPRVSCTRAESIATTSVPP